MKLTSDMAHEIAQIGARLRTQDNRITQDPVFVVQQQQRYGPLLSGYGHGRALWRVDADDAGMQIVYDDDPEFEVLVDRLDAGTEELDGWFEGGYVRVWETVQPFLTDAAAERYLADNRHNLSAHGARVYAESAHRNPEIKRLREYLAQHPAPKPVVAWRCVVADLAEAPAVVFSAVISRARYIAVRSYWDAYGRQNNRWPLVRIKRAREFDHLVTRFSADFAYGADVVSAAVADG